MSGVTITKGLPLLPELMKSLPADDQALLKKDGRLARHAKGHNIQREGSMPTRKGIILAGHACLEVMGRVVEIVGAGTVIGSTFSGSVPNTGTYKALSPVSVASFDIGVLSQVCRRNPDWALALLDIAIVRIHGYQNYLHQLGNYSVEARLAALYWSFSTVLPDGSRQIPGCINQTTLASLMRIAREEVNKKRRYLIAAKYLYEKADGEWYLSPLTPVLFEDSD